MTKQFFVLALLFVALLPAWAASPLDSTDFGAKPIDAKTFKIESTPIADNLDSLMSLHVFKLKKTGFPKNYDSTYVPVFEDSIYRKRMAVLDASTPMQLDYNPVVRRYIDLYAVRKREQVGRMLALAQYYFPMFEQVLDKYNMPLELKYLAVVESALNPNAKSPVGATGLWQFMYPTGKLMGLHTSSYVDERHDPYKSTVAACEYMTKLYKIFGDWNLVLAAYNSGPGNVSKAIRRSGGKTNYWELRAYLPRETAGYVPAFIAVAYTMRYAKEHNLYPTRSVPFFETTDTIFVRSQITFDQLNMFLGIDKEQLKFLNPQYKLGVIPHIQGQPEFLVLPRQTMGLFVDNEEAIYTYANAQAQGTQYLFQVDAAAATSSTSAPETAKDKIVHKVKSGESLGLLSKKYGVSVSTIKKWNHLRSNTVQIGQKITIYTNSSAAQTAEAKKDVVEEKTYYTVRQGDTLTKIANKYPGVSASQIAEWNNINANKIRPGMKLVVRKGTNAN